MTAVSVAEAVLRRLDHLREIGDHDSLLEQQLTAEVQALRAALEKAKGVLEEADKNRRESQPVPEAEKEIIFYKCENDVEEYAQQKKGIRNTIKGTTKNAQRNLRNLKAQIDELSEKCKGQRSTSKHALTSDNPSPGALNKNKSVAGRRAHVRLRTKGLVDMEENIKKVLASADRDYPVIPILGDGGTGKTTLAKKVYEDAKATGSFNGFAWYYLPSSFDMKSMLQAFLIQLHPQCPGREDDIKVMEMEDVELANRVFKLVKENKCLIVVDVRAIHVWQSIRIAFPLSETDSKILLTTRSKDVAEESASGGRVYEMIILNADEGWELFEKKALADDAGSGQIFLLILGDCLSYPKI
ncbi:putative disease resistance protein RGA3 [Sesamum angolense]|uniref:Disease resistance protein RGA3 n=1 Tax=Sesamum angolense TaxID=2727404 RepID=A0AAE2C1V8_9LAMI|nr:putative disease resistance protein RGA3 [Sesamum angolense]